MMKKLHCKSFILDILKTFYKEQRLTPNTFSTVTPTHECMQHTDLELD